MKKFKYYEIILYHQKITLPMITWGEVAKVYIGLQEEGHVGTILS